MISFVVVLFIPFHTEPAFLSLLIQVSNVETLLFLCVFFVCLLLNLFSAWGEGVFVVIQTAIVAALVLLYGTKPGKGKRTYPTTN